MKRDLKTSLALLLGLCTALSLSAEQASALEQIVRPYWSARSAGMGGVRITTGVYEENFFGNPARVTQNPRSKFQILDLTLESTFSTIDNASDLIGGDGDDLFKDLASTAGENNHLRAQLGLLSVYRQNLINGKWSFGFGILMNTQADLDLRNNYQVDPTAVADIGPALTVGTKLLENDALSVGATAHLTYRVAGNDIITLSDFLNGETVDSDIIRDGTHLDFDIGATYVLPFSPAGIELSAGAAINNILGGNYSNIPLKIKDQGHPIPQPRTLGFGVAARKPSLWVFTQPVVALEFTDIGNNPNGSLFKTVHLGGEVRYGILSPRLGLNQGYIAGGLGVDLRFLQLDVFTYGEEMSLNVGGIQDRRVGLRLGLQI